MNVTLILGGCGNSVGIGTRREGNGNPSGWVLYFCPQISWLRSYEHSSYNTADELYVSRREKWGQVDLMSYVHIVLLPKISSVLLYNTALHQDEKYMIKGYSIYRAKGKILL